MARASRRRRVHPTDDWEQLELPCPWPERGIKSLSARWSCSALPPQNAHNRRARLPRGPCNARRDVLREALGKRSLGKKHMRVKEDHEQVTTW